MIHKIVFFIFKLIGIVLCVFFWDTPGFWWMMGLYSLPFIAIAIIGSANIKWNYHIKSIHKGQVPGVVLTFDDGPHPEYTPRILEILKQFNVKATFFVIGEQAKKYPELIKEIDQQGHIIGNHSYSHRSMLPLFLPKKLRRDFDECNLVIAHLIKKIPVFIRPPFGATSPFYFRMMRKAPYQSIGWTVRSFDTVETDKNKLLNRVLSATEQQNAAHTMLFHDTQTITIELLPHLLEAFEKRGTKVVSLSDALNKSPYENC